MKMIRKSLLIFNICLLVLLCGCTNTNENTIITWYINSNDVPKDAKTYEALQVKKFDKLNELLEKEKMNITVEFKYSDASYWGKGTFTGSNYIKEVQEKDKTADIINFDRTAKKDFTSLTSLIEKDTKIKSVIPEKVWNINKVLEDNYYFPITASLMEDQQVYRVNKEFYDQNQLSEADLSLKPIDIAKKYFNSYVNKEGYLFIPMTFFDPYAFLKDDYVSLSWDNSQNGLALRLSDNKVVNPFEEEAFIELFEFFNMLNEANVTGFNLEEEEYRKCIDEDNIILGFSDRYIPDSYYAEPKMEENYVEIPFRESTITKSGGYGILKTSDSQKEAYQLLSFINTNKEASDLLLYGIEGEDYEREGELVYPHDKDKYEIYATWNTLGNFVISSQNNIEAKNKGKLFEDSVNRATYSKYNTFYPDNISIPKSNDVFDMIAQAYSGIEMNQMQGQDLHSYLASINKNLKDAGMDQMVVEYQKQFDAFMKE